MRRYEFYLNHPVQGCGYHGFLNEKEMDEFLPNLREKARKLQLTITGYIHEWKGDQPEEPTRICIRPND